MAPPLSGNWGIVEYLERALRNAKQFPERIALQTSDGESETYGAYWRASEGIASLIRQSGYPVKKPVMVYGHKSPRMIECFHACLKTGHPYVPVDCHSVPPERVANIAGQIGDPLLLAVEDLPDAGISAQTVDREQLEAAVAAAPDLDSAFESVDRTAWVSGDDLAYILFTSGSTGAPKGVCVTASCIDGFCRWALTLGDAEREGAVFLNQAPFSFDLSVYEQAMSFWAGGTLYSLTKESQDSFRLQMEALAASRARIWVSTPSFAEMCLVEPSFDEQMMPDVRLFLFCGETLPNGTAARLLERFPHAQVVNSYGPTESTVAVTACTVTGQMAASSDPLPVGRPRKGTRIDIVADNGEPVPAGECGEIVIAGDTVARGYLGRPDLTAKAFGTDMVDGKLVRTYRTGDEGWLDASGMLHYRGRLDLQVKMNGFRIELGEIEENLRRLPCIKAACVVPSVKDGQIRYLVAHVVWEGERTESDFRQGLGIKEALKDVLPHYMIPRKVVFHDALPMTPNGKCDRKALARL
jgi:D-alanine--poly(phosphoribitol) ligase subunit 1